MSTKYTIADIENVLADLGNNAIIYALDDPNGTPVDAVIPLEVLINYLGYFLTTSIISVTENTLIDKTYAGKIIEASGTITITLPDDMPNGMRVDIVNIGTGTITIAASTTLQSKDSKVDLADQYGGASVYHRGSNVWAALGDLS